MVKQDLVPCILVTFEKEQIVVWRGKDYKPPENGYFLADREPFEDLEADMVSYAKGHDSSQEEDFNSAIDETPPVL